MMMMIWALGRRKDRPPTSDLSRPVGHRRQLEHSLPVSEWVYRQLDGMERAARTVTPSEEATAHYISCCPRMRIKMMMMMIWALGCLN